MRTVIIALLVFLASTFAEAQTDNGQLLRDVAAVSIIGSHEADHCALLRRGAQAFDLPLLDSLAVMLENHVLDKGNRQTMAVAEMLLNYAVQHFGQTSREAVVCRRQLLACMWEFDWEKTRMVAEENERCAASLLKEHPHDQDALLLSLVTRLELLVVMTSRDEDNPSHWESLLQIEKELQPWFQQSGMTYTAELVDCCRYIANLKQSETTWQEYVNRLIHDTFPEGSYLDGRNYVNDVFSNMEAFMQHAVDGSKALWGDNDLRYISIAADQVTMQMRYKLEDYDTLHARLTGWHDYLTDYLPPGDPMADRILLSLWECDVRYRQNLYEVRSPYPMLFRFESYYGKDSQSYLSTLFQLTSIVMQVNPDRGQSLINDLKELVSSQCDADSDLYGSYLLNVFWLMEALQTVTPEECQEYFATLASWYEQHHRPIWESLYVGKNIANIYLSSLSLADKASAVFQIVLDDVRQLAGEKSLFYVSVLENLASSQSCSNDKEEQLKAIVNSQKAIAVREQLDLSVAMNYWELASQQLTMGQKEASIATLRQGIGKCVNDEDGLWRCMLKMQLGWNLHEVMGLDVQGEPKQLFDEAIPFFLDNVAQVGGAYIEGFNIIGNYYIALGDYQAAEAILLQGIDLHSSLYNVYDFTSTQMLNNLYTVYAQYMNDFDKAEQLLEGRLEAIRQNPSSSIHAVVLQLLWNRYYLLSSKTDDWMLRFTALNEITAEIKLMAQLAGVDSAIELKSYALPVIYEYANMCLFLGQGVRELESHYGDTPSEADDEQMAALRQLLPAFRQVATEQMLPLMLETEEELKQRDNYLDNYATLDLYLALANYYIGMERDTLKAEDYYRRLAQSAQPNIRDRGKAELARLSLDRGSYETAAKLYEELESTATSQSLQERAGFCSAIGEAYIACGRYRDAIPSAREFYALRRQELEQNFDLLTLTEREAFVKNMGDGSGGILLLLPKFPDELAADAYNATLHSKGLLLRASERIRKAIMRSGDKELQALVDSLNLLTSHYKTLNNTTDWVHGNYNYDPEVVTTRQHIETLERSINRRAAQFIEGMDTPDWKRLQSMLKKREAAVEYVLSDSISLGALVLLPKGSPRYVPLASATSLWHALDALSGMNAEQRAEAIYRDDCLALYDQLWKPVAARLGNVTTVYYSPSGFLNELAFAAIPLPDGTCLADHYELHQMLSTGNLVALRTKTAEGTVRSAVLLGSVYYSPDQEQLARQIARGSGKRGASGEERGAVTNEDEYFGYLSFTKDEVETVGTIMSDKAVATRQLTGFQPTEAMLHAISGQSPDVLHLSTHGFFLHGDKEVKGNAFLQRFPAMQFSSMQRAGLALVDANHAWEGADDKPEDNDGIITANEVAQLDLSTTRLAVLSACQTAVGDFSVEGVYGMHRGFKQAGVRSILASLWNVNDRSTARLMELFYARWLAGMPMQQSFNEAVKELRIEYPSPFHWAPFVLMDAVE